MDIVVRPQGLYVDAWLEDFLRTTVQFATWRAAPRVVSAHVSLRRRAAGDVACEIVSCREDGSSVSARAVDGQAFEAIQLAADRIEVALFGPSTGEPYRESRPRAAA